MYEGMLGEADPLTRRFRRRRGESASLLGDPPIDSTLSNEDRQTRT